MSLLGAPCLLVLENQRKRAPSTPLSPVSAADVVLVIDQDIVRRLPRQLDRGTRGVEAGAEVNRGFVNIQRLCLLYIQRSQVLIGEDIDVLAKGLNVPEHVVQVFQALLCELDDVAVGIHCNRNRWLELRAVLDR